MELKPGYKQTELGIIPDDWEVKPLGGLVSISHGYGFSSKYFTDRGRFRLTTPGNFFEQGGFRETGEKQKFYVGPVPSDYVLDRGDMIVAMTEQAAGLLGSAAWIPNEGYLHNQRLGRVRALSPEVELAYLYYVFNSMSYRSRVRETAAGTKVKHTSPERLLEIFVRFPPEPEQRAIAVALRDIEALLKGLEQLIAKKRDLKQAAIQQLLTGKTRLPGFTGEWETRRLGEMLEICHGKSQREVETEDGPYPILATGGQIGTASRPLYDKPSVLIGRKGTIDQPQYMDRPFWTVDTLFYSRVKNGNSAKFLFYLFCRINWKQYNEASGVPSLNAKTIEAIEMKCPKPPEQVAIAAVLTDIDTELEVLEQRFTKTRDLKQAMMQELLTGKTRLVAQEVVHA